MTEVESNIQESLLDTLSFVASETKQREFTAIISALGGKTSLLASGPTRSNRMTVVRCIFSTSPS
jgi:hypothetical protein